MLRSYARFAVIAVVVFFVSPSYAAPNKILLSESNVEDFRLMTELSKFGIQAACYGPAQSTLSNVNKVQGANSESRIFGYIGGKYFRFLNSKQIKKIERRLKRKSALRTSGVVSAPASKKNRRLRRSVKVARKNCESLPPVEQPTPTPEPIPTPPNPEPTPIPPLAPTPTPLPLSVTAGGPYSATEGGSVTLHAEAVGGQGVRAIAWDLDGDGIYETPSSTVVFNPNDSGSVAVSVVAGDSSGAFVYDNTAIAVSNVAPAVSVGGNSSGLVGQAMNFTANASDLSSVDQDAGLNYTWSFGDGSPGQSGVNLSSVSHSYQAPGAYTVRVSVADKDLGTSVDTHKVTISSLGSVPIPELALFEENMLSFGNLHCQNLTDLSFSYDQRLASTYYDMQWVYFQIGDYTGDTTWYDCAQTAESIYRDQFVMPTYNVPGFWNFSHGLVEDFLRTGDQSSRNAVVQMSHHGAFAGDAVPLNWTEHVDLSREVAYLIMNYYNAEALGEPHRARTDAFVQQAYGHMDQWFVQQDVPFIRPFMVSLTSHALMRHYEETGDPNVIPVLITAMDWLWDNTWLPEDEAFKYTDREHPSGGQEPAADLNLLVAPVYGWLYRQTGILRFRDRGDEIFAGGVKFAWLYNGKQFNQSYRLGIQYVELRQLGPLP